jgi:UDP-N-acetylmuramate dehydrogenase
MITPARPLDVLHIKFGDRIQENVSLAPYTSARIGGLADIFLTANSADELAEIMTIIWQQGLPYVVLGGGSNVLVSDKGVRGAVILNRAKEVKFHKGDQPKVWVESGVVFSNLANRCTSKGLSGLEWAAGIPGTVGGAVVGNAGAFGSDISANLIVINVLTKNGCEQWPVEKMEYGYRTSVLKRSPGKAIVLSAELGLKNSTKDSVSAKIGQFSERRKNTQPPGASMGSMFKNPAGNRAGRLIEAAGLKGTRIGNAEVSPLHGNFFINHGKTKASDMRALIELVQKTVKEKFDVELEAEVELIGDWSVER